MIDKFKIVLNNLLIKLQDRLDDHNSNFIRRSGIKLFDLALIHLRENGCYVRITSNSRKIIVFPSWWTWLWHNRERSIIFDITGLNNMPLFDGDNAPPWIWISHYKVSHEYEYIPNTMPLCQIIDPNCLDKMLNEARKISNLK